ncbi:MAG: hypothetical protein AAFY76_24435 [Cyanobacteria bacterium J06649_11]
MVLGADRRVGLKFRPEIHHRDWFFLPNNPESNARDAEGDSSILKNLCYRVLNYCFMAKDCPSSKLYTP